MRSYLPTREEIPGASHITCSINLLAEDELNIPSKSSHFGNFVIDSSWSKDHALRLLDFMPYIAGPETAAALISKLTCPILNLLENSSMFPRMLPSEKKRSILLGSVHQLPKVSRNLRRKSHRGPTKNHIEAPSNVAEYL